jgi:hypothetical protein
MLSLRARCTPVLIVDLDSLLNQYLARNDLCLTGMYLLLILASLLPYMLVLIKLLNQYLARNDLCITGSPVEKKFSVGLIPLLLSLPYSQWPNVHLTMTLSQRRLRASPQTQTPAEPRGYRRCCLGQSVQLHLRPRRESYRSQPQARTTSTRQRCRLHQPSSRGQAGMVCMIQNMCINTCNIQLVHMICIIIVDALHQTPWAPLR